MDGFIPSYNGLFMFGPAAHILGRVTEPARHTRGFVGLNGLVTIAYGSRGTTAEGSGCFFGDAVNDLLLAEEVLDGYMLNGLPYTLIDSLSKTWPKMIMTAFRRVGSPYQDPNGWARQYEVEFLGLVTP